MRRLPSAFGCLMGIFSQLIDEIIFHLPMRNYVVTCSASPRRFVMGHIPELPSGELPENSINLLYHFGLRLGELIDWNFCGARN